MEYGDDGSTQTGDETAGSGRDRRGDEGNVSVAHLARAIVVTHWGKAQGVGGRNSLVILGMAMRRNASPGTDGLSLGRWVAGLRKGLREMDEIDRESDQWKAAVLQAERTLGRSIDEYHVSEQEYLERIKLIWNSDIIQAMNKIRENRFLRMGPLSEETLYQSMTRSEGAIH